MQCQGTTKLELDDSPHQVSHFTDGETEVSEGTHLPKASQMEDLDIFQCVPLFVSVPQMITFSISI